MSGGKEALARTLSEGSRGRLVLCPTPIGNLRDVTLRVLDALGEADAIACEDTRRTRVLLARYQIEASLVSFHEHNEDARAAQLASRVQRGEVVALVSDAGMPLLSDPGYALVRACLDRDLTVEALPGPSSVTTAIVASGLPAARWRFAGFLPRKRGELAQMLAHSTETLVAFESPGRLVATLQLLAELDPGREVAVCRELSKLHEEVRRAPAQELATHYRECQPRGEIVLVVAAAAPFAGNRGDALAAVRELVQGGARPRAAAAVVAKLTGVGANELYRSLI